MKLKIIPVYASKTKPTAQDYKLLKQLSAGGKQKLSTKVNALLTLEVRKLRQAIRDKLKVDHYLVHIIHKGRSKKHPINLQETFKSRPTLKQLLDLKKEFYEQLREFRKEIRVPRQDTLDFLGLHLSTVGGIPVKRPLELAADLTARAGDRIRTPKKPVIKSNHIGVELECITKSERPKLIEKLLAAKLAGFVYVKDDSSIRTNSNGGWGSEGGYTHEVTVLAKETEVDTVLDKVCAVLKEDGGYVNESCGTHVHIDMRQRDPVIPYFNLVKSTNFLFKLVSVARRASQYCNINRSTEWTERDNDRYRAINATAYSKFKTLEVRLHSGTINANTLKHFIKTLLLIVNKDSKVTTPIDTVANFSEAFGANTELTTWLDSRVQFFSTGKSALDDHKLNAA